MCFLLLGVAWRKTEKCKADTTAHTRRHSWKLQTEATELQEKYFSPHHHLFSNTVQYYLNFALTPCSDDCRYAIVRSFIVSRQNVYRSFRSQNLSIDLIHALHFRFSHVQRFSNERLLSSSASLVTVSVIRTSLNRSTCPNHFRAFRFTTSLINSLAPTLGLTTSVFTSSILINPDMLRRLFISRTLSSRVSLFLIIMVPFHASPLAPHFFY